MHLFCARYTNERLYDCDAGSLALTTQAEGIQSPTGNYGNDVKCGIDPLVDLWQWSGINYNIIILDIAHCLS
jgi:hypothetical protein